MRFEIYHNDSEFSDIMNEAKNAAAAADATESSSSLYATSSTQSDNDAVSTPADNITDGADPKVGTAQQDSSSSSLVLD